METGPHGTGHADFAVSRPHSIIEAIVDNLQPLLAPYEAAFYWYLFRYSIARNGNPLIRVSTRRLQSGVVKSNRSDTISLQQVRETLAGLERVGAVRRENQANRDGTLYRVLIPDQIEACRQLRNQRTAAETKDRVADLESDCYNVRENRMKIYERDAYRCHYCGSQLTRFTATLDHVIPVADGGDNSFGNLVTACLRCNSRKAGRPVGEFLAEHNL